MPVKPPKLSSESPPDLPPRRPAWWPQASRHLSRAEPAFKKIIQHSKALSWREPGEPFPALARAITGQQISVMAANRIWERVLALLGLEDGIALTPEGMLNLQVQDLRQAGLSERKALYMRSLAEHFVMEGWTLERFHALEDEAIIEALTAVHGIGRWTVEMFLIFTLHRPNILPLGDLGFRQAIDVLYPPRVPRKPSQYLSIAEPWRPYGSAATWCLWQLLKLDPEEQEILRSCSQRQE